MPPEVEMGDREPRHAHPSDRWTAATEERRRRLQEHVAEIQAEQAALDAAPSLTGRATGGTESAR